MTLVALRWALQNDDASTLAQHQVCLKLHP